MYWNRNEPLTSTAGICSKFNSPQLLFEQFFFIIGNFSSVQQKNEPTFPFQYIIIFETYQSSEIPSSTPG